jgi:iron complex transport system substrate-binding protein
MRRLILSVLAIGTVLAFSSQPQAAQGAAGFSIDYREGYKVLTVRTPWPGSTRTYTYVLYKRGSAKPSGIKADRFFETPVRRVVTFSTTYLPQIVAVGEADSVVGVDSAAYVNTPEIRSRIASGKTVETTRNWAPNVELMLALAPDAVFTYGMGNEWDTFPKLLEAGLPIVINGDWNEANPLARAEWSTFVAAFYDKENLAAANYDKTAAEYSRLKKLAASAKERPRILVNGPFQGSWSVSGGASYMARFIADAGGRYLWAEDGSSGGLVLSVEAVYERGLSADIWLNPALGVNSVADVIALDSRFGSLPVVRAGAVWNNNLRMSPEGGNDYFESAILNPDAVLADLIKIFHPALLNHRPFTYYRKVVK